MITTSQAHELLQLDTPWPLRDTVEKLVEATEHLLQDHDCDAHGHEVYSLAAQLGRKWLAEYDQHEANGKGLPCSKATKPAAS